MEGELVRGARQHGPGRVEREGEDGGRIDATSELRYSRTVTGREDSDQSSLLPGQNCSVKVRILRITYGLARRGQELAVWAELDRSH